MENQPIQATQRQPDVLSWQYILLAVALALLIPAIKAAPITIERAARPLSLDELELTEVYEDASGISIAYPAGWDVLQVADGQFLLSNYPEPLSNLPSANGQMALFIRRLPLTNAGYESGTDVTTIMQDVVSQLGTAHASVEILAPVIDGKPGAHINFQDQGMIVDLAIVGANENDLVVIESFAKSSEADQVSALFSRFLESMVIDIPASQPGQ
jgi:hypothetical protein